MTIAWRLSARERKNGAKEAGLIKKARELSILCDSEIARHFFQQWGKLYEFCNGNSIFMQEAGETEAKDFQKSQTYLAEGIVKIKSRCNKNAYPKIFFEQERMLIEENEHLEKQIVAVENNSNKANGVVLGFNLPADNYMNCDPQLSTLLLF